MAVSRQVSPMRKFSNGTLSLGLDAARLATPPLKPFHT